MTINGITYLGGAPFPFNRVCNVDITVNQATKTFIMCTSWGNKTFVLQKNEILDVQTESIKNRSVSKGLMGYAIGRMVNKNYGSLVGAAIGAREEDMSNIMITYSKNNGQQSTIILQSGKKTYKVYAAIMSL